MKKRFLAFALATAMVFSLAGCGTKEKSDTPTTGTTPTVAAVDAATTPTTAPIDMSGVKLKQDGTLTVGVEIGYPPFEDFAEDGKTPVGFDVDFATAVADKLGLKVNFINTAWDGIFAGIDKNYDVVISAVTITNDRKETMLFSDPYINNYQAVVVRPDFTGKIKSFTDLDGMTLAVQKETTSDVKMSDLKSTGTIKCTISANEKVTTCFTQLENKEVGGVGVDSTVADGYLAKSPDKYVKAFQDDSQPEQFGVAMGKNNTALQAAINKAVAELKSEGFLDDNYAAWFKSTK